MRRTLLAAMLLVTLAAGAASALPTENLGVRVLPAPGKVTVDGKFDDWDLSGGIFICDDPETQRDRYAVWFYAMYDAENFYVLARWIDETPLNNPGVTMADHGFQGDCLQFRIATAPDSPDERCLHLTCWKGKDQKDVIKAEIGKRFDGGVVQDLKKEGAQQAFTINADGKGYVQEIALPWKLLTKDGQALKAGARIQLTVEPNFTVGASGRMSLKDVFKPGVTPDRVFTFMANTCWGYATLEAKGKVAPQAVRLADAREFPVKIEKGVLAVDWAGLVKSKDLPGFKDIEFTMPEDGYVSLHILNAEGTVVRQLLNDAFMTKGKHKVKWDGLSTWSVKRPGEPLPAGEYTWEAIWHKGVGLKLRGWAHNSGYAPWDDGTGKSNWGGDHGVPCTAAAEGETVVLGWNGAEAGQAVVGCDLAGNAKWRHTRTSMTGVSHVALADGIFYGASKGETIYRVEAKTGAYSMWEGTDSCDVEVKNLLGIADEKAHVTIDGLAAGGGKVYLSFTKVNKVLVLDAKTGKLQKTLAVEAPGNLATSGKSLLAISGGQAVLAVDPESGEAKKLVDVPTATAIATDKDGKVYVGTGAPDNQVKVFAADGKPVAAIGKQGGRAMLGPWTPDGMAFISGLAVDAEGKLWVAEADHYPKRVSVWDAKTGRFIKEFFGATVYGASGGAIDPLDPTVMVGHGCEWKLDPKTGRDTCVATITRDGMSNSRFGVGSNGKLYLAVATGWAYDVSTVRVWERTGEGQYKLRAMISYERDPADKDKKKIASTVVWADENGDGEVQDNEVTKVPGEIRVSGWYMMMAPDLTFYSGDRQIKVAGFTACGAPKWDFASPVKMPVRGMGSADGKLVLQGGEYGTEHGLFTCKDIASGKLLWTYPDNFVGVHGSHNACPPEVGMIRGSFDPCGVARLPEPVGNVWVVPTNVGEWHVLTGSGFYLTRLFQPDPLKVEWPKEAVPGAAMDNCPCGMGGEDFGGSIASTKDGKLFLQAGKTGFWNVEVTGLDTVKALKGGKVSLAAADLKKSEAIRDAQLQANVGTRKTSIRKMTPTFTGDFEKDFKGAEILQYKKQDDAAARSAAAWDDQNLYLAWDVRDRTPWQNTAGLPEQIYCHGDSVDFQIGADPKAAKDRTEAALGDLRLSIGDFKGKPTAVLFRKVWKDKSAKKVFSSGVVKEYPMDSVTVIEGAKIEVKKRGDGYVVEAAVPLAALDLKITDGLMLRGDFGVLHGDAGGADTVLRTYWNNQHTGIVNDEVFELMMEPKNWGELTFKQ